MDSDGDTIELGVRNADDEKPDSWYPYPLVGTSTTPDVSLAHAVGSEVMSVSVAGRKPPNCGCGPTPC
ncbi:hypothetical protein [Streptomyces sannanensis]